MMVLLEYAATFLEAVLEILAVGSAAGWRYSGRKKVLSIAAAALGLSVIVVFCNALQAFSLFTFFPALLANVLLFSYLYTDGPLSLRFAGHILCITCILIVDYILCVLLALAFGWGTHAFDFLLQPGLYRALYIIIVKGTDIALYLGLWRLLQKLTAFPRCYQNLTAGFAAVLLLVVQLSFADYLVADAEGMMAAFALLWLLLLIVLLGALFTFAVLLDWTRQKQAFERSEAVRRTMLDSYLRLKDQRQREAGARHDFVNHLLGLRGLLAADQTAAKDYIDRLLQNSAPAAALYDTGCEIVDAVLNVKAAEAQKDDIDLVVDAHFDKNVHIAEADICTVLANQLDNALEACRRLPAGARRQVRVKVLSRNHIALFEVENTVDHDPFADNPTLKSTKKEDGQAHGMGLANIRRTVERYNGHMELGCKDGVFRCTALLSFLRAPHR